MSRLVYLDSETTGLDPDRHEMWELAIIDGDNEWEWQLPVDLSRADPSALRIGRFYDRRGALPGVPSGEVHVGAGVRLRRYNGGEWRRLGDGSKAIQKEAQNVAGLLDGAHVVGAIPWFDCGHGGFVSRWLRAHGQQNTCHYHLIDVEALAVGYLHGRWKFGEIGRPQDEWGKVTEPPWSSDDLSRAVGVNPDDFARHTALGDARWAKAIDEAVTG